MKAFFWLVAGVFALGITMDRPAGAHDQGNTVTSSTASSTPQLGQYENLAPAQARADDQRVATLK